MLHLQVVTNIDGIAKITDALSDSVGFLNSDVTPGSYSQVAKPPELRFRALLTEDGAELELVRT